MKKIIVVDDDPEMREFISMALKDRFNVQTAPDGMAGLELVQKEQPDLVILDLLMPRMHGFEVCQRIRADERLKNTKVLISSSKSYAHDINTAKSSGADKYIVKPFELSAFLGTVDELVADADTSMELAFWGTRGSLPSPGPLTQKYGGNTPCTQLRIGETNIIIDSGSGIRELGASLLKSAEGKPISAHLLIGHTHWDHIQGFPFFTPFYDPKNKFTIYGVHGTTQGFKDVLSNQMSPTYFPVAMKDMPSKIEVAELSGPVMIGSAKVSYHYLNHPGITVGFRIESQGKSISYLSDHEPYAKLNNTGEFGAKEDADVARFVAGSDLLICESQYTEEEYKMKRSWGHSTFPDVMGLALNAGVKQLALFHHDPAHTDEMMDRFTASCQEELKKRGSPMACFAAQEGMKLKF